LCSFQQPVAQLRDSSTKTSVCCPAIVAASISVQRAGDRFAPLEERTKTWDKTIVERQSDLTNWVDVFKAVMTNKKVLKIFAFANNHYAGHAPDTVKLFWKLWNGGKG
jgi:uncharacterized protein YecE (DUF72 family)